MSADDLLPANSTPFERAASAAGARLLNTDTNAIRRERDPNAADPAFVPFLAWERSVHFYDPADLAGNRARAASSFADHGAYGSPDALEAEIALDTGLAVHIVEAHEERDLVWPGFAVEVESAPCLTFPDLAPVLASAMRRKNVRDMPRVRNRVNQAPAPVHVAAAHFVSIRVSSAVPRTSAVYVGATHRTLLEYRITS